MPFFFWTKYPFVQVGSAFIMGNALAYTCTKLPDFFLATSYFNYLLWISTACGAVVLLWFGVQTISNRQWPVSGTFVLFIFLFAGFFRFLMYDERHNEKHFYSLKWNEADAIIAEVTTEPEIKKSTVQVLLEIKKIRIAHTWISCQGKVYATFPVSTNNCLSFHQCLLVAGRLVKTTTPDTPYDFNYAAFLAYRNIHYTLYSQQTPRILTQPASFIFSPTHYALQAKQCLEHLLKNQLKDSRTLALVTGLLIGKRSDLQEDDKLLFTNSGTIHVLAVSGMHVVLIYQCLVLLASCLPFKTHRIILNTVILLLIWFYIFITGLQASASRAAVMISIVLIGNMTQRDNLHINSLFATAFLMLLYNPYYIADIGFILSFLAVAGILISSSITLEKSSNIILNYIFTASLISISAQVMTLPYSIHLFHQFPVYFLLANLVVVPLSTLLLFLSILLLFIHSIPLVAEAITFLLYTCTDFLFYFLHLLDQLPSPLLTGISLNSMEMVLFYVVLVGSLLIVVRKKIQGLWGVCFCSVILALSLHRRMVTQFEHPALLITGKKENRQYLFSIGREAFLVRTKSNIHRSAPVESFLTDHFIHYLHVQVLVPPTTFVVQVAGKSIGILQKRPSHITTNNPLIKKCEVFILDYKAKYPYLDQSKDKSTYPLIFPLQGKKSFYKNTTAYELDTN